MDKGIGVWGWGCVWCSKEEGRSVQIIRRQRPRRISVQDYAVEHFKTLTNRGYPPFSQRGKRNAPFMHMAHNLSSAQQWYQAVFQHIALKTALICPYHQQGMKTSMVFESLYIFACSRTTNTRISAAYKAERFPFWYANIVHSFHFLEWISIKTPCIPVFSS